MIIILYILLYLLIGVLCSYIEHRLCWAMDMDLGEVCCLVLVWPFVVTFWIVDGCAPLSRLIGGLFTTVIFRARRGP
jgi:hypothetical protein